MLVEPDDRSTAPTQRAGPEKAQQDRLPHTNRRLTSFAILLAVLAGLMMGCRAAHYPPRIDATAALDPTQAYRYGRFRWLGWGVPSFGLGRPLSLELASASVLMDERVHIKFAKAGADVYPIAVAPGTYQFTHLLLDRRPLAFDETIGRTVVALPVPLGTAFTVHAGNVYYVGDYVAKGSVKVYFASPWGSWTDWRWQLEEASLKYDETTEELKRRYPAFRTVVPVPAWPHP